MGFDATRLPIRMIVALGVLAVPCLAKERQTVTVSYMVGPSRPLPEGLNAVAVIDSGVTTTGTQVSELEQKWSSIAADMIEAMLQSGGQWGGQLAVAKRRQTQQVLMEQDLRLAGLVQGEQAAHVGKLLAVQGLITSRLTINIDVQRGTKSTIDWVSVFGSVAHQAFEGRGNGRRPPPPPPERVRRDIRRNPRYVRDSRDAYSRDPRYAPGRYTVRRGESYHRSRTTGGLELATRDVEEISRALTVQCSFALIDAVTGAAIMQYTPPPYRKLDKSSPDFFFGSTIEGADLDPVDVFIGELVERATQEFVGMLVPVRVEATYELVGRDDEGEAGIRALRADDYEAALRHFAAQLREEPDEHETAFAMGVTCELMGDYHRALDLYRKAVSMKDVDEDDELPVYMAAKDRLTRDLPRILVPGQPPPAEAAPSALPPAEPPPPVVPPPEPPPPPSPPPKQNDFGPG